MNIALNFGNLIVGSKGKLGFIGVYSYDSKDSEGEEVTESINLLTATLYMAYNLDI